MLSAKYIKQGHVLDQTYLYACWIILMRHYWQILMKRVKGGRKSIYKCNIGEVWNLVCCHSTEKDNHILWSTYSRILLQRITQFCCKLAEISYIVRLSYLSMSKIWLSVHVWHHHLAVLLVLKTWISLEQIEIFENSKQHFSSSTDYLYVFLLIWLRFEINYFLSW